MKDNRITTMRKNLRGLTKDDILHVFGLETRRYYSDYMWPALGVFGVGCLVGAGLGLLFAPKSGRMLREDIGRRTRRSVRGSDILEESRPTPAKPSLSTL